MNPLLFLHHIIPTVFAINTGWGNITDGIGRLFTGGNWTDVNGTTHYMAGILGGDPMLYAILMFLFFFILAGLFGMGMLVGSVVLLPLMFALFAYIPPLRIIIAIIVGLIMGFGLHRIIRR